MIGKQLKKLTEKLRECSERLKKQPDNTVWVQGCLLGMAEMIEMEIESEENILRTKQNKAGEIR